MKIITLLLSIILTIPFIRTVKAQFPQNVTYQSIQSPNAPAIPNYGQSVLDNSVPTDIEITRVTEYQAQWNWYPTHEYSKTQVWNIDQTKYKVASWKVYNATTYLEEQTLSSMYPSYWSNTNPDLIWSFREDGDIKKYTVSTNTTQTVANIPGYELVKLGPGEANIDKNDHYVALVGKKVNLDLDVIVFDLLTNQVIQTLTFGGAWGNGSDYAPQYIDWVSVSQSGNYVVVLWSNPWNITAGFYTDQNNLDHYGLEVYNRVNMQFQNRIDNSAGHGDLGYAVDGDEVYVQFQAGQAGVYMQKLNGTGETLVNSNPNFTASGHVSCRNTNRPGWAYVTIPAQNLSGQIVAIKLDNSNTVEHFGHHFSSNTSYDQSPMAVASPNGDKICFKSDFGTGQNDGDIAYSFFASINSCDTSYQYIYDTACYSYVWSANNHTYTSSGIYYDTIQNSVGCDSIQILNLTINQSTSAFFTDTACDNYTWAINSLSYYSSGVYKDTITNSNNCDSIITLNLTIYNETSDTIYHEICNDNQSFVLTDGTIVETEGVYTSSSLNVNNCNQTTIYYITTCLELPIQDIANDKMITIYPNPAKNEVFVKANQTINKILVFDLFGQQIATYKVNSNSIKLDISKFTKGIVLLKIYSDKKASIEKLFIQ